MDIMSYKKYEPIFGSWYITKMLGEGSFGKVFEIERQDFGTTYKAALKVITVPRNDSAIRSVMASGMDNDNVTEYFESLVKNLVSEFELMSKLKGNSHVVSYEDHQVIPHNDKRIGWDILIRMELLTPLLDYVQNTKLTRRDIMKLGIDMCHALELCQQQNVIHRDIKPENIFISESGNFKLGDFGVARTVEKTATGMSKQGTYKYMAPEIYKNEKYGSSVDIYSLGIVMYQLLNRNRAPFLPPYPAKIKHDDTVEAQIRRFSGETLPAPSGADGRFAEIVLKACAYNPKDRYSSPMQMRQELEAILYDPDNAKVIYPQGDEVVVEPNQYATPDHKAADDYGTEPEGTIGIFNTHYQKPAALKQDRPVYVVSEPIQQVNQNPQVEQARETPQPAKPISPKKGKKKTPILAYIGIAVIVVLALAFFFSDNNGSVDPRRDAATPAPPAAIAPPVTDTATDDSLQNQTEPPHLSTEGFDQDLIDDMLNFTIDSEPEPTPTPEPQPTETRTLEELMENTIPATITMEDGSVIEAELFPDLAPQSVRNFVYLARQGFYDGLRFHRIMRGFMIQGGCPEGTGGGGPGYFIKGEFELNGFRNDLSHTPGILSMARRGDPMFDTAGSQFFIVHGNATFLDGDYAGFGRVTRGLDVVDEIAQTPNSGPNGAVAFENMPVIASITIDSDIELPPPDKIIP